MIRAYIGHILLGGELELDLCNSHGRVETLRAGPRAVEDSVATIQAHLVLHLLLTLLFVRVLHRRTFTPITS